MIPEIPDHRLIAKLKGIPFESRQMMSGNVSGRHKSPHRGSSVEFAEYRKYVPGDDTRRLDWKAFARSDRYYIKEFEADTNLRAVLCVDLSGSMNFSGKSDFSKLDRAYHLTSVLSYLLVMQGDAAGLHLSHEREGVFIPPSRRPAHLKLLCDHMKARRGEGQTCLVDDLHVLAEKLPRRSLVIVMSDLFVATEELSDALNHLRYKKHDVVVFHLLDELEQSFDFDRPMRFVDMESRNSIVADPAMMKGEYLREYERYRKEVRTVCQKAYVDYHPLFLHEDPEEVLRSFLLGRVMKQRRTAR